MQVLARSVACASANQFEFEYTLNHFSLNSLINSRAGATKAFVSAAMRQNQHVGPLTSLS